MGIDTVEFQDDNASPHKKVCSEIEEAGKNCGSGIGIELYKQPPRSPDPNALDLYVWRVLSAGVNRRLFFQVPQRDEGPGCAVGVHSGRLGARSDAREDRGRVSTYPPRDGVY